MNLALQYVFDMDTTPLETTLEVLRESNCNDLLITNRQTFSALTSDFDANSISFANIFQPKTSEKADEL